MDLVNELIYESNILMKETEPQLLRTSLIELGILMGCIFIGIFIFLNAWILVYLKVSFRH